MDPFVGEIRIFGFNFAPKGWALCNGQLMPISQNTALFSLLGTMYGGDGKSTFALPDLQGSAPLQCGQGPGLTHRDQGEVGGSQTVTLLESEIPSHSHAWQASIRPANNGTPSGDVFLASASQSQLIMNASGANVMMAPEAIGPSGGSLPHNNMQPYLGMIFCIALQGIFPPRS
ncbi:phage tail protein [Halopseudomonas phragmitis]|uniref:Phage tail protein n=2 Tax=Pseudomonadaceae TaxID=135621 RepID=A0A1V0B192_9GAMM|nr:MULTISPECIES: tail fiber protein [Pseudomonadaceae]AQZ93699.1 phage tail protein [Halopseudomonas phragmitis]RHW20029.1 phage tail protein [Pseudomonas jilinensis]